MNPADRPAGSRLDILNRSESLQLLGDASYVGRVGFMSKGRPLVLPVNYLLDGESVVFRTAAGTILADLDGSDVAFEVDDNRPLGHSGWSVVVQGTVRRISDAREIETLRRGPLRSWAWQAADQWLRVSIDTISGRRVPGN